MTAAFDAYKIRQGRRSAASQAEPTMTHPITHTLTRPLVQLTRSINLLAAVSVATIFAFPAASHAQLPPSIGYVFPAGGQAGTTSDVVLGGYDWTPDMQCFVHDDAARLEIIGASSEVLVPDPPYWFGIKARRAPSPLPREFPARLTIDAAMAPGIVTWQVANANGGSSVGKFFVTDLKVVNEIERRRAAQPIDDLPVVISGRLRVVEEVDRYEFVAKSSGLVTCQVVSRAVGTTLNAVLAIHDDGGRLIAECEDTAGIDTALTFAVDGGRRYTVSLHDVDFRGDFALVYNLCITDGPRVVATVPAKGQAGQTASVEVIGFGVATGSANLETVTRQITFPDDVPTGQFLYRLETEFGAARPYPIGVSRIAEHSESSLGPGRELAVPSAVTGVMSRRYGEVAYQVTGEAGDVWSIRGTAESTHSPLDIGIAVVDSAGTERARADDSAGRTDAELSFTVPENGPYKIIVSDTSPAGGTVASTYRLSVEKATPGFTLAAPEGISVPIGGKANLAITANRIAGFADPITVVVTGLPAGVTVPSDATIPAGQTSLNLELSVDEMAAAAASVIRVEGRSTVGEAAITAPARPVLVATTLTPPFEIDAEGQDDVTKWPRGTTFPGPVLIERKPGFDGPIRLEMTSRQGRHRMGIRGGEVVVPPGVGRFIYPVFLPEWLETTRTSRMVVNGVAEVADPAGNVRHLLVRQKTRMGFLPTGAILKLSAKRSLFAMPRDGDLVIPLTIDRSDDFASALSLELVPADGFAAQTIAVGVEQTTVDFVVRAETAIETETELTIRATGFQDGQFPVVSEATVIVTPSAR
jgi:hypothetical protein